MACIADVGRRGSYRCEVHHRGIVLTVAAGLTLGTASLAAGASSSLDAPASVFHRARRIRPSQPDLTAEDQAIVDMVTLINIERGSRGLPFLHVDDRVNEAAHAHAADMAAMGEMQHTGSDGSDGGTRLTRAGFEWSTWAENIGAGFFDARTLFDTWMSSDGHRSNILGDFSAVGVGVVATSEGLPYWSLLVASEAYAPTQP